MSRFIDGARMVRDRRSNMLVRVIVILGASFVLSACASVMSSVTSGLSDDLSRAVLESEDVAGVRDGAPAFLLLLDGLLVRDPNNTDLLISAARLNGAYATAFVDDPSRQALLSAKSLALAERAVCIEIRVACSARTQPFDEFSAWVAKLRTADVEVAYALGSAWAGWIQVRSDDWDAIAELSRVKALMAKVAELDGSHDHGGPYLYLGVLETLLPPAMGGRPEVGRDYFEHAIEASGGRYLMVKVMFARSYARLLFDRELHDELLNDVLSAPVQEPGLTLVNAIAQEQARALLAEADEFF